MRIGARPERVLRNVPADAARRSPTRRARLGELARYGTVGAATGLSYFGLYSLGVVAGVRYFLAAPLAFVVTASAGYFLHEYWTFKGRRPSVRALLAWLGAQSGIVALSLALLSLLVGVVGLGPILAQALLMPLAPVLAYALSRALIFTRA